jgi:hypothetical protein
MLLSPALERVRRRWRQLTAGFAHRDTLKDASGHYGEEIEWSSLDSDLIAEVWGHVHLIEPCFGGNNERRDVRLTTVRELLTGRSILPSDLEIPPSRNRLQVDDAGERRKGAMLVNVRERAELLKSIFGRGLRETPVRLRVLNSCPYLGGNPQKPLETNYLKPTRIGEDRVGCPPTFSLGSDLVEGMVEGGTKVLDCLPGEQRPMIGGRLPLACEAAVLDIIGRTTLTLYAEHISLGILELLGFPAKRLDLFYASRKLSPG